MIVNSQTSEPPFLRLLSFVPGSVTAPLRRPHPPKVSWSDVYLSPYGKDRSSTRRDNWTLPSRVSP